MKSLMKLLKMQIVVGISTHARCKYVPAFNADIGSFRLDVHACGSGRMEEHPDTSFSFTDTCVWCVCVRPFRNLFRGMQSQAPRARGALISYNEMP